MSGPTSITVSDDDGHAHTVQTARRPAGLGYFVVLLMLLAAIGFYLFFAIPEFMGIVSGPPLHGS